MIEELDEPDFETQEFFTSETTYTDLVFINGIKTEINFICCRKGFADQYFAVNLSRKGTCINSYTMVAVGRDENGLIWRFDEDAVPKEIKSREKEFSELLESRTK